MSKRSDAIKNEKLIIKTANELFNMYGVDSISMKKIAEAAQIGKGTLYRHFSNKSDICSALLSQEIEHMFNQIDYKKKIQTDQQELLRFIFLPLIEIMEKNVSLIKEIERSDKKNRVLMQTPFYVKLKSEVMSCITKMDIVNDPDFHADILLNSFSADVFEYQHYVKKIPSKQFVDRILKIFVRGIQSSKL